MASTQKYDEVLRLLSEGSVETHFDPFLDIPWDDPEYRIDPTDPRWKLPEVDALGGSGWYRSLPHEQQIAVGLWRQANVTKVGLQFENLLIRGLMQHVYRLPNGTPEFRYCTHEATEETHHTQMFQEFVNRSGADVPGMPPAANRIQHILPFVVALFPEWFFTMVLAGEEPIDHLQKEILRSGSEMPPLLERIMSIHIAEESRHISFAHEYLRTKVPDLDPIRKFALSVLYPITMRVACDLIVIPGPEFKRVHNVPDGVISAAYRTSPEAKRTLRDLFGDVRALAEETGLMNPVSRRVWKLMGIDGRSARYRSEIPRPHRAAA